MAKNSIRDYDATSGNNTDVQSVDISEGCAASGINNALREIMTDLKNVSTGAVALETPAADQLNVDNIRIDGNTISSTDTNGNVNIDPAGTGDTIVASGNVGIGVSDVDANLDVSGGENKLGIIRMTQRASGAAAYGLDMGLDPTTGDPVFSRIVNDTVTEAFRIERSTGNVGIGRSPVAKLDAYLGSGVGGLAVGVGGASTTILDSDLIQLRSGSGAERMRIESGGNIKISDKFRFTAGGDFEAPATGFSQGTNSKQFAAAIIYSSRSSTSSSAHLAFYNSNGEVGTITTQGSSTAYNTSSDHRLKENVADMTGAIARVKALAPKRFNFIADADTTVDGFLAHEAQVIVPESVTGTHNEVDENGNAVMQGIDQSKLVPLLVGALKESIAKIETLETQRADLEARLTALENA